MPGSDDFECPEWYKKMTKWDRAEDPSRSSLEAAAEAAAKVNAMLIAKGKLKPSQLSNAQQSKQKSSQSQSNMEMAEVDINDVPLSCRNLLTRGSTQDEISKMSGAAVSTRGRFMTPEDRVHSGPGDRPLYLCVQGPSRESVDKAVLRIREIIASSYRTKGAKFTPRIPAAPVPLGIRPRPPLPEVQGLITTPPPLMSLNTQPAGIPMVQEKILIGLEHAPPNFDVKNKILGPMGSFLQHIQTESGSKVTLHGKGSGFLEANTGREAFEPMHVLVQHPTVVGLQQAKTLAENLIQTVQREYAQFQQALATMPTSLPAGSASLMPGLPPQPAGPPIDGMTWSLQQPPPGMPVASVAPLLPQVPVPQQVSAAVGPMMSGAYTQNIPQGAVLVNTSVPPPNFGPPPAQTSTPLSLPPGSGVPLGPLSTQQHGGPVFQQISVQSGPPPPITQPQASLAPSPLPALPGAPIMSVTAFPPPASQPGIVQVAQGLHPPPTPPPPVPQSILTQPPPGVQPLPHQQLAPAPVVQQPQPQPLPVGSMPTPVLTLPPGQVSMATPQAMPPVVTHPPPELGPGGASHPNHALPQGTENVSQPGGGSGHTYYNQYVLTSAAEPAPTTSIAVSIESRPHKRRFTEEKQEDKLPDNLLGYQHGPPHLAKLVNADNQPNNHSQHGQPPTSKPYGTPHHEDLRERIDPTSSDRQLMPPPPPPIISSKGSVSAAQNSQEKQLLPPPLPPIGLIGSEGPASKKIKGEEEGLSRESPEPDRSAPRGPLLPEGTQYVQKSYSKQTGQVYVQESRPVDPPQSSQHEAKTEHPYRPCYEQNNTHVSQAYAERPHVITSSYAGLEVTSVPTNVTRGHPGLVAESPAYDYKQVPPPELEVSHTVTYSSNDVSSVATRPSISYDVSQRLGEGGLGKPTLVHPASSAAPPHHTPGVQYSSSRLPDVAPPPGHYSSSHSHVDTRLPPPQYSSPPSLDPPAPHTLPQRHPQYTNPPPQTPVDLPPNPQYPPDPHRQAVPSYSQPHPTHPPYSGDIAHHPGGAGIYSSPPEFKHQLPPRSEEPLAPPPGPMVRPAPSPSPLPYGMYEPVLPPHPAQRVAWNRLQ